MRLKYRDIDASFSARSKYYSAMGGSDTYTGTNSQNTWMLSQMRAHGYKKGSKDIPYDQLALTQEEGQELVARNDGSVWTVLGKGDKVFTNGQTDALYDFSKDLAMMGKSSALASTPEFVRNDGQNVSVKIGDIKMTGVNNPEEFGRQLKHELQNNNRIIQIIQEETLGQALGHNKLKRFSF